MTKLFRFMDKNTIWKHLDTVEVVSQNVHTPGPRENRSDVLRLAVEVVESTVRNGTVTDALYDFSIDRSAGVGRGWLFKFDDTGNLLGQIELTDGTKYHPGWHRLPWQVHLGRGGRVSTEQQVAYFRVDPDTLEFELAFAAADHIVELCTTCTREPFTA